MSNGNGADHEALLPPIAEGDQLEQYTLGVMIQFPTAAGAEGLEKLREEHFENERHRSVLKAMQEVVEEQGINALDDVKIAEHLFPSDRYRATEIGLDLCGWAVNQVLSCHRMGSYIRLLEDRLQRRRLGVESAKFAQEAKTGHLPPSALIDRYRDLFLKEDLSKAASTGFQTLNEIMGEVVSTYDSASRSKRSYAGLETDFPGLNDRLNGLCPSELTVVGARPGMGKTTLALQIAMGVMRREEVAVGFFSLEMTALQLGQRLACLLRGLSMERLRRGRLNEEEVLRFTLASGELANMPMTVDDSSGLDSSALLLRAERQNRKSQVPIGLWIIDYLQLMQGIGDTENERINACSRVAKRLSKDTGAHVLVLSQLSREVERRVDHKPILADLRGSGGIEQDADNVLMIYQPGLLGVRGEDGQIMTGQAALVVAKSRYGPIGEIPLRWRPDVGAFAEESEREEDSFEHYDNR